MRPKKIVIIDPVETKRLIERVNRDGLEVAAEMYDASPSTLSRWLKTQGYEMIRQYILKELRNVNN